MHGTWGAAHLHDIAGTLVSDVPELVLADPLLLDAQPPKLKKLPF
jgi:hypothetical protein